MKPIYAVRSPSPPVFHSRITSRPTSSDEEPKRKLAIMIRAYSEDEVITMTQSLGSLRPPPSYAFSGSSGSTQLEPFSWSSWAFLGVDEVDVNFSLL